ncbi:hypothetical protein, partial [Vibrio sp. CUB2]|uniref:hypothetical protein n=1 Tax=Vibrio sp. CUB2 TaxID=2315233 RepID=UPI003204A13D
QFFAFFYCNFFKMIEKAINDGLLMFFFQFKSPYFKVILSANAQLRCEARNTDATAYHLNH